MVWICWVAVILVIAFGWVVVKGAPYVPSHRAEVKRAFSELYHLDGNDTLVDLGSGDGIVLREAASRGARAIGYEINPILVFVANCLSHHRYDAKTVLADFWKMPLPSVVTLVYIFTVSRDVGKIAARLQSESNRLGKTLAVISYGAKLPGMAVQKQVGAHCLYEITPLQQQKA